VAEAAGRSILALAILWVMKPEEVQVVCDNLGEILDQLYRTN